MGGEMAIDNLRPTCSSCYTSAKNRMLDEYAESIKNMKEETSAKKSKSKAKSEDKEKDLPKSDFKSEDENEEPPQIEGIPNQIPDTKKELTLPYGKEAQRIIHKFEKFALHIMAVARTNQNFTRIYNEMLIADLTKFAELNKEHKDFERLNLMLNELKSTKNSLLQSDSNLKKDDYFSSIHDVVSRICEKLMHTKLCRDAIDACVCDSF
jgi:hypothetical protein